MLGDNIVTCSDRVDAIVLFVHAGPGGIIDQMTVKIEIRNIQFCGDLGVGFAQFGNTRAWKMVNDGRSGAKRLA